MNRTRTINIATPARLTASLTAPSVDLRAAGTIDGQARLVLASSLTEAGGNTLDVKLQGSADNAAFADIPGLAFAQVTSAANGGVQEIPFDLSKLPRYVRAVSTVSGAVTRAVMLVADKKYTA